MKIKWVHFPLHPNTPPQGRSIADMFRGRGVDLDAMHSRMSDEMAAEGLPYGKRTHTYNSRLAQELGTWGDKYGDSLLKETSADPSANANATQETPGDRLHSALYRAYFVDGRDISNIDELVAIAESVGLPADKARSVLETREFSKAVDADWAKSQNYEVTGVPTFVAQGMGVPGAQPYEVLSRLVEKATEVRNKNLQNNAGESQL